MKPRVKSKRRRKIVRHFRKAMEEADRAIAAAESDDGSTSREGPDISDMRFFNAARSFAKSLLSAYGGRVA
jgi:hypothetical protein